VSSHLEVIAEHQARLFDLFLRERLTNLSNLADDPQFPDAARHPTILPLLLAKLQRASEAFVDVGVVDGLGGLIAYAGPVEYPAGFDYRNESWFRELASGQRAAVITDISGSGAGRTSRSRSRVRRRTVRSSCAPRSRRSGLPTT
jgi:two-component system NtrC family sensor kinase